MKRNLICLTAVLAVSLLAVATWGEAAPKRGGVLKTAVNFEPPHWDPQITYSYTTQVMTSFVYSRLLRDKQGVNVDPYHFELQGDLAEKWEVVSPTEIVFTLRKGVKFHNKPPVNGRELTSADVKYSFERLLSPEVKAPARSFYEKIKSIETPDPYTAKFILSEPFAPFLTYVALTFASIIPKEAVEEFGDLKKWDAAIGTGPFMIEKYEPNVKTSYKRNPDYFEKDRPYLDGVEIRVIKNPQVFNTAVRSNDLDLGLGTPFPDYEATQEMLAVHPGMKMVEYHNNNWPRVTFATDQPPFNDKSVRQAMSMSFDRAKQLMIIMGGRGWIDAPLTIAQKGAIPHDELGEASKLFQYNPAEAKRLLMEAGLKPPVKVKMVYTTVYGAVWVNMVEAFAGQMKSSGNFDVELVPQEYGAYISSTTLGKYKEDGYYGLSTPPADPDGILWSVYHSTAPRNASRVKDPHVDQLLEAQRRELDETKRSAILKELQLYLADQMYYMPTVLTPAFDMWFPYVKGYNRHIVPWYNWGHRFSLVWLDK
jgi:peptide/nickel transport system substrate-binding protein